MLKQVQHDIFLCFSLYDTASRGGGFTWKTIFYLCFRDAGRRMDALGALLHAVFSFQFRDPCLPAPVPTEGGAGRRIRIRQLF